MGRAVEPDDVVIGEDDAADLHGSVK